MDPVDFGVELVERASDESDVLAGELPDPPLDSSHMVSELLHLYLDRSNFLYVFRDHLLWWVHEQFVC